MGQAEADYGDDEVDANHDQLDHPDGDEVAFLPLLGLRCHCEYVSVREKSVQGIVILCVVPEVRWSMIECCEIALF